MCQRLSPTIGFVFSALLVATGIVTPLQAQADDGAVLPEVSEPDWEFSAQLYSYFTPHETDYVQPTVIADHGALHLEARYNYEDFETYSAWLGYNFNLSDSLEVTLTPMLGAIFGKSDGLAPGYRFYLSWEKFEFSSEGEYVFDQESSENDFFYNWSEFLYSPTEKIWFGLAAQRTRIHDVDLEVERGLTLGTGLGWVELNVYAFEFWSDDRSFVLGLARDF